MARALRIEFHGAIYHVTSCGNRRQRIYDDDRDREHLLNLLEEVSRRYSWRISVYVLMTNHFHLVLQTPEPNLALGMKWLNSTYASWYNRRHQKVGHLFGDRYKGIHGRSICSDLRVLPRSASFCLHEERLHAEPFTAAARVPANRP